MAIPKSKSELLELSQKNFLRLFEFINTLPSGKLDTEFPKGYLNRNIRDVLGHLHHWHLLFLDWYKVGMTGEKPEIPAKGYTWKTNSDLNRMIQKKYQDTGFEKIKKMLEESHLRVHDIIQSHTDEELFEKKRYKWTGSTSLGVYLRGATTSHYDWGYKLIKKCLK
jgi:hypothetical protein